PSYNLQPTPPPGYPDYGGPATLFAMHPTWDAQGEWQGLTFTTSQPTDAAVRSVILRDVTFTNNGNCLFFTANLSFQLFNATMTNCVMEMDKIVDTAVISGSTIDTVLFQSAGSFKNFTLDTSTVKQVVGTPKTTTIKNSTITALFKMGATT